MTVFAVFREGIYRHECLGIFSTRDLAVAAVDAAVALEPDAHHTLVVIPFQMDDLTPSERPAGYIGNPDYQEPDSIYKKHRATSLNETG